MCLRSSWRSSQVRTHADGSSRRSPTGDSAVRRRPRRASRALRAQRASWLRRAVTSAVSRSTRGCGRRHCDNRCTQASRSSSVAPMNGEPGCNRSIGAWPVGSRGTSSVKARVPSASSPRPSSSATASTRVAGSPTRRSAHSRRCSTRLQRRPWARWGSDRAWRACRRVRGRRHELPPAPGRARGRWSSGRRNARTAVPCRKDAGGR